MIYLCKDKKLSDDAMIFPKLTYFSAVYLDPKNLFVFCMFRVRKSVRVLSSLLFVVGELGDVDQNYASRRGRFIHHQGIYFHLRTFTAS